MAEEFVQLALKLGAEQAKIISPQSVVTAQWVRWKCQYGCEYFNRCLTCPPFSPTPSQTREMLAPYQQGILFSSSQSFTVRYLAGALEREVFLAGYYATFALGAGPCHLCEECDPNKPCLHPYQARPSMEACGIDVFATVRNNGLALEVLRETKEPGKYFGLLLLE
ncbi:MAG: DUF2284 domain-containing protein [bacterium]